MTTDHRMTMQQKHDRVSRVLRGKTIRIMLTIAIVAFTVLDVMQTSTASTKGYEISQYQEQIRQLEHENRRLAFDIATHRSMDSIQERLQGMSLVEASNATYISIASQQAVAQR